MSHASAVRRLVAGLVVASSLGLGAAAPAVASQTAPAAPSVKAASHAAKGVAAEGRRTTRLGRKYTRLTVAHRGAAAVRYYGRKNT